jgi:hypothetical protein
MRMRTVSITPPPNAEDKAEVLAEFVQGIFKDEHPAVVSVALTLIAAAHFAGHRVAPETREKLVDQHKRTVRELIPVFDQQAAEFEAKIAGKAS